MRLDFRIADLSLAHFGRTEIRLAEKEMPGLMAMRERYAEARPLAGARITGSLHMTVQTAVLIETLVALGARVRWASCNVLSTQDHAAAAVVVGPDGTADEPRGVPVFAWKGETEDEYWWCNERALFWPDAPGPNMILDDGADATVWLHEQVEREKTSAGPGPWSAIAAEVKGITEETTMGVTRVRRLARQGALMFPVMNVNDSATKSKFDNRYGSRHSLVDGLNRAVDLMIGGKTALVVGYGDVGKGCVAALRAQGARVVVAEIDPICALQAGMDGVQVSTVDEVIREADIVVTATGASRVITVDHLAVVKHNAVVANIGHSNVEIDMAGLAASAARPTEIKPQVHEWTFPDGHSVIVLSEGRLVNLGNSTGHPSFIMSNSFTNQVLAQIELYTRAAQYPVGLHRLPKRLDEEVARLHLPALGASLSRLTEEQADYLGVPADGPFKPDHYRY